MKLFSKLSAVGVVLTLSTAFASATTYQLGSYGTASSNFGNQNTAMVFNYAVSQTGASVPSSPTTVNIPATAPWSAALTGTSSWISYANTSPGVSPFAPNGLYVFSTTFTLDQAATAYTLNLLADDTLAVFLDDNFNTARRLEVNDTGSNVTCQVGQPNCTTVTTIDQLTNPNGLALLTAGSHTLYFVVFQNASQAMGMDFTSTITTGTSPVPEPGTLFLLGTGLIGSAGTLMRRLRVSR